MTLSSDREKSQGDDTDNAGCVRAIVHGGMLAVIGVVLVAATGAHAEPVWVGRFSASLDFPQPPWKIQQLNTSIPPTAYRFRDWDGVAAIEATAVKSMALLARPLDVDLAKTPVLCWRWRIESVLKTADMKRKAGDDYAARVYLSFAVPPDTLSFGIRFVLGLARSLHGDQVPDAAINYLWDNRHPIGTWQANAYTDRARMLVLRTGTADVGSWVNERRDVSADFQKAYGYGPSRITGLAIASDTDNTGEEAHAGFADFRFVAANERCAGD